MQNNQSEIKRVKQPRMNNKRKNKRRLRKGIIAIPASLALLGLTLYLIQQFIELDLLPTMILFSVLILCIGVSLIFIILLNFKCKNRFSRFICGIVVFCLIIVFSIGGFYLRKTNNMFTEVTSLSDKITNTISIIALKDSGITKLVTLKNKTLGTVSSVDQVGTQKSLSDLSSEGISYNTLDYENITSLVSALYNNEVDAIVFNEAYRGTIHEIEDFWSFNTDSNVVHKTIYYTDREYSLVDTADPVKNILTDTFTIFISGNDSYGSLNEQARSDVNMLVTVNPETHTVLMTNIPRDSFLEVKCEDQSACYYGQYDKLTHTGLSGIMTTEQTIENFLDMKINYNVRVNFSSLVDLVDAIGGIDVLVEPGLEVVRFAANDTKGVTGGWNHLEGERALAFARERHAYADGDLQRTKNQQIVMKAIIDKLTSPLMFSSYGNFMDALSGAFETNLSEKELSSLVKYEISLMPTWQFAAYAMFGEPDMQYCPSLGDVAYVTAVDAGSLEIAKEKINAVYQGKTVSEIEQIGQ